MSTAHSSKRLLLLFKILVFCFAVVSWSSSLFLNVPLPITIMKRHQQPPASFELMDDVNSSQYATWSKDNGLLEQQTGISYQQTLSEESFIQQLQLNQTQGHNTTALSRLSSEVTEHSTITTIIRATDKASLKIQLDALTEQTMATGFTWILCSRDLQAVAETYADLYSPLNLTILVTNTDYTNYPEQSAGATPWISLLTRVQTDYVWILEDGVKPSPGYLKTIFDLLQTVEYRNSLLGTHATLLPSNQLESPLCLPSAFHSIPKLTRSVDMVHHIWLLRTEWIPALLMERRPDALRTPLSYYISQSLLMNANVPSIVIPPAILSSTTDDNTTPLLYIQHIQPSVSCTNAIPTVYEQSKPWKRLLAMKTTPTALEYQISASHFEKTLFFIDGPEEAHALLPLICRFDPSLDAGSIHVVVTGKQRGLAGLSLSSLIKQTPACNSNIVIHDLDHFTLLDPVGTANHISSQLARWIQALKPSIAFYIHQDTPLAHSVTTLVNSHHLPAIKLPIDDVQHALWITKLPLKALKCWNQVKIDLVVITDRRPHSLSRLFNSIGHGTYLGDKVDLTVHMEQTSDRVTRMFVHSYTWNQGKKRINHRVRKGGLMPAIVESWYPSDNDNYGVILEDDIEVSPLFYVWIKYNILHYRYSQTNLRIYGISLYSPRNLELLPEGRIEFDPNDVLLPNQFPPRTPYASQVPCSWGAVYFPEHWREFHQYLTTRLLDLHHAPAPRLEIHVPNSRSERWKKSWKKYFIEMVYLRAYVMVYPNFQDFESFSTNHLEFGTHIKHERAQVALDSFVVPLMQRDTILSQLPDQRLPRFDELPTMDLWGDLMRYEEMEEVGRRWHQVVSACVARQDRFNPQDILCPHGPELVSLDVAAMTTTMMDYERLDDQLKDLLYNWNDLVDLV